MLSFSFWSSKDLEHRALISDLTDFFKQFTKCAQIRASWTACFAKDCRDPRPSAFPNDRLDGVKTKLLDLEG